MYYYSSSELMILLSCLQCRWFAGVPVPRNASPISLPFCGAISATICNAATLGRVLEGFVPIDLVPIQAAVQALVQVPRNAAAHG